MPSDLSPDLPSGLSPDIIRRTMHTYINKS
ncbi:hypothetical protein F383_39170 [Gossypium arboreum]|uniref:Uncharacterized protein n=1 Tax=Gossypium arboreum TaxID=29729 RepID=A0A0B0MKY1_GOSAR|nr:hypothetical protein F383_39170 [Gossypium arboreum]